MGTLWILREEFEAWVTDFGKWPQASERSKVDGSYRMIDTYSKWLAWQASREALVIQFPYVCGELGRAFAENYKVCLERQGLKVSYES